MYNICIYIYIDIRYVTYEYIHMGFSYKIGGTPNHPKLGHFSIETIETQSFMACMFVCCPFNVRSLVLMIFWDIVWGDLGS